MAKNPYGEPFDEDNDFGFTFANEDEIVSENGTHANLQVEIQDLKERLQALNKMFRPLLENLSKNPEKPMIKWPNRKEIIDKQLKKLDTLTKV